MCQRLPKMFVLVVTRKYTGSFCLSKWFCTAPDQNPSHIYVHQVPNGPLDKDGLDEALTGSKPISQHSSSFSDSDGGISQADNNSSQLPPVVIVPGLQNPRTEEELDSKQRGNLWVPLQLKRFHARVWSSLGRAGWWKDKIDPRPFSRAGSMGNHTKVNNYCNLSCKTAKSMVGHRSDKFS